MSSVTDLNETTSGSSSGQPQLLRVLSARTGTALIVGGIIGSGIFMVPSSVASQVGSPSLSLLVWVAAGLLSLAGAFCSRGTVPYLIRANINSFISRAQ